MAPASQVLTSLQAAGLSDVLYLPGEQGYNARIASYWSLTAQLQPWGIVQPRNTLEVSKAVKAIVAAPGVKFAVRRYVFQGKVCFRSELTLTAVDIWHGRAQTTSLMALPLILV